MPQLVAAITDLESHLLAHLSDEEQNFLPIAASVFTLEEWSELPGHTLRSFTGDKPWLILGLVIEQMSDAQRATILPHLPPPVLEMWNGPGIVAFNAFIADLRGTVEPAGV